MKILVLFLAFSFLPAHAQKLVGQKSSQGIKQVTFVKVAPGDSDSFEMTAANGRKMILACAGNLMFENKRSFLRYVNFYGIAVDDFRFADEGACQRLTFFLLATFEGISAERPVVFNLDLDRLSVESVLLPKLDPYEDGLRPLPKH